MANNLLATVGFNMRTSLIPVFSLLIAGWLPGLQASGQSEPATYTVIPAGQPMARNSFAVFCPTNIPAREDVRKPEFGAEWSYSGRDWQSCAIRIVSASTSLPAI